MSSVKSIETIDSTECAELLRCTTDQIEELARAGDIPGLKFGRSWLFVRYDLLSYLAEKARSEAQERRAKRQPNVMPIRQTTRRRVPPQLQTLAFPTCAVQDQTL